MPGGMGMVGITAGDELRQTGCVMEPPRLPRDNKMWGAPVILWAVEVLLLQVACQVDRRAAGVCKRHLHSRNLLCLILSFLQNRGSGPMSRGDASDVRAFDPY